MAECYVSRPARCVFQNITSYSVAFLSPDPVTMYLSSVEMSLHNTDDDSFDWKQNASERYIIGTHTDSENYGQQCLLSILDTQQFENLHSNKQAKANRVERIWNISLQMKFFQSIQQKPEKKIRNGIDSWRSHAMAIHSTSPADNQMQTPRDSLLTILMLSTS